jgi:hypothetical protein
MRAWLMSPIHLMIERMVKSRRLFSDKSLNIVQRYFYISWCKYGIKFTLNSTVSAWALSNQNQKGSWTKIFTEMDFKVIYSLYNTERKIQIYIEKYCILKLLSKIMLFFTNRHTNSSILGYYQTNIVQQDHEPWMNPDINLNTCQYVKTYLRSFF